MATYYPKYFMQDAVGYASSDVKPSVQSNLIDFSVQNLNFATSDVALMIPIPAYSQLLFCNYRTVTTVAGSTGTFSISDGTNTLVATAVAVAAGSWGAVPAPSNTNIHIWYAADAGIQINSVATANLTSGQIQVFATLIYPQPNSYKDVDGTVHTYVYIDRNNWTTTKPVIP